MANKGFQHEFSYKYILLNFLIKILYSVQLLLILLYSIDLRIVG